MKGQNLGVGAAALCFAQVALALPQLLARQSIDFDLVNATPDPIVKPDDATNLNPAAAIASVIAEIQRNPLPQAKRALQARDVVVTTYPGYTDNIAVGNAAINAPLDCNKKDTYMGVKLFTTTAFDTALCAAACTAQTKYNLAHPPSDRPAKTCQFYNTYALYKNDVYQGQYCTLYSQTWDTTYAVNKGQTRGTDRYTIRNSFIASNAADPGVCVQAGPISSDFCLRVSTLGLPISGKFIGSAGIDFNLVAGSPSINSPVPVLRSRLDPNGRWETLSGNIMSGAGDVASTTTVVRPQPADRVASNEQYQEHNCEIDNGDFKCTSARGGYRWNNFVQDGNSPVLNEYTEAASSGTYKILQLQVVAGIDCPLNA